MRIPIAMMFVALAAVPHTGLAGEPVAELVRAIELPVKPGPGPGKEVKVLLDVPQMKLAVVTLRGGTVFPEHSASVPVTIQALSGTGTLKAGTRSEVLAPDHMVFLEANVAHEVIPDGKGDLVLLIHHLKLKTPAR